MSELSRAETNNHYAVCIGINHYCPGSHLPALAYAKKDAEAVHALLLTMGFKPEHCCLLTGSSATLDAINSALRRLVLNTPQRNDLVVVYFAGHGVPLFFEEPENDETGSEVFLAPYDFDRQHLQEDWGFRLDEALSMERLRSDYFLRTHSNKVLFLFDCCYSGDFFGPLYRGDSGEVVQRTIQQKFASTKAGGRVALSSCLPVQRAVESALHEHGLFTYHLLEALSGRAPSALRHDGSLTVGSLFDYLCTVLPSNQRPVRSGVEQDAFELARYPEKVKPTQTEEAAPEQVENANKEKRLRALLVEQKGLVRKKAEPFVGRHAELKELRRLIAAKQATGGYITITGQAGQGKSCLLAKMILDDGLDDAIFHFIPFRCGPDYKITLLRNLIARLLLKYHLSDWYAANDTYPALRDFFPKILEEVVAKQGKEVIYIDGVDQLEEDWNGKRDLSFLPDYLPPGIVLVLGTRPNDTLSSLTLLQALYPYQLPNLSRRDFDRVLERHHLQLAPDLGDQLYDAMQENALFLDLLATELLANDVATPETIIECVADNPENLFTLSFERLHWPPHDWQEIIKSILGVLLVAREPLTHTHIRQIIKEEDERVRHGLARLGGLLSCDDQHRYALYHLKLRDYLRQDEQKPEKDYLFAFDEESSWHVILAEWCEHDDISSLWLDRTESVSEQERREYARRHYIMHLYYGQVSTRLFAILDKGEYGIHKVKNGLNILEYVWDLDIGRKVASKEEPPFAEGVATLPSLWRYALLRSKLTSCMNKYPLDVFKTLIALGRINEVANIAELLSDPAMYTEVFLLLAQYYLQMADRQGEGFLLLERILKRVSVKGLETLQICTLGVMGHALKNAGKLEQAQECWKRSRTIVDNIPQENGRDFAQVELVRGLSKVSAWREAESVIGDMRVGFYRNSSRSSSPYLDALIITGACLFAGGLEQQALSKWDEVEARVMSLPKAIPKPLRDVIRDEFLRKLLLELIDARQLERADAILHVLKPEREASYILCQIGTAYAQIGEFERAEKMWSEAEACAQRTQQEGGRRLLHKGEGFRIEPLWGPIATAYASTGNWEQAENTLAQVDQRDDDEKIETLACLALISIRAQQVSKAEEYLVRAQKVIFSDKDSTEQAEVLTEFTSILSKLGQWDLAEQMIRPITNKEMRAIALVSFASELTHHNQRERAQQWWQEVETIVHHGFFDDGSDKTRHARLSKKKVVDALIQAKQWSLACTAVKHLDNSSLYEALHDLGCALIHAEEWAFLRDVLSRVNNIHDLDSASDLHLLVDLGLTLTKVGQEALAKKMWRAFDRLFLNNNQHEKQSKEKKEGPERENFVEKLPEWAEKIGTYSEDEQSGTFAYVNFVAHGQCYTRLQDITFWKVLDVLLQARQWQRALSMLRLLQSPLRILGVCKMVCILSQAEAGKHTSPFWEQARQETTSITSRFLSPSAQASLSEKLRKEQIDRNSAHPAMVEQYVLQTAERIGVSLQKADQKSAFFIELGLLLAQIGHRNRADALWKRVKEEIHTIKNKSQRVDTLIVLSENLEASEQARKALEEAVKIADSIQEEETKAESFIRLASAFARLDRQQQAEQCWHKVEKRISTSFDQKGDTAARLYGNLAYALARHGELTWAEHLISAVDETSYSASLIVETLQAIAAWHEEKKDYKQLLGLVQRSWRRVQTREKCIKELALVKGLIAAKPDIARAFCEAFPWVDNFLAESFSQ